MKLDLKWTMTPTFCLRPPSNYLSKSESTGKSFGALTRSNSVIIKKIGSLLYNFLLLYIVLHSFSITEFLFLIVHVTVHYVCLGWYRYFKNDVSKCSQIVHFFLNFLWDESLPILWNFNLTWLTHGHFGFSFYPI